MQEDRLKKFPKKLQKEIKENENSGYGYVRISDQKQIGNASIETQTKLVTDYCKEHKLKLIHIYKDEGVSGRSLDKRDDFKEMLKVIKPGNFIVVNDMTRFGRDQADITHIFKELVHNKGCRFICLNPGLDSINDDSDFMVGLYAALAQRGSKEISTRVKLSMRRLSEQNKLLNRPPFGYILNKETHLYEQDEEQQKVIEMMEMLHLCGNGFSEIARKLNDDGYGKVLNNNKIKKLETPSFNPTTVRNAIIAYGFDERNLPKLTTPERIKICNDYRTEREEAKRRKEKGSDKKSGKEEMEKDVKKEEIEKEKEEEIDEKAELKKQLAQMSEMMKLMTEKLK